MKGLAVAILVSASILSPMTGGQAVWAEQPPKATTRTPKSGRRSKPTASKKESLLHVYGPVTVEAKRLKSFQHDGPVRMQSVYVAGDLQVNGPLTVNEGTLHAMVVNGPVLFEDVVVMGTAKITGSVQTKDSVFLEPLTITSSIAKFENTVLPGLKVIGGKESEQVVYLSEGSVVSGDIEFQSGKGIVVIENSQLLGEVKGGEILR